jgi:hypothetical protein
VIRFAASHDFLTGDAVRYDARGFGSIGGAALNASSTYYVQKIDELTIKLFATKADATAAAQTINLAAGATNTLTVSGAGFTSGTRVTYREPAPVGFTRDLVEQKPNPNIDKDTPSSQYFIANGNDNSFGITGHGFTTGDRATYRTNGTAITGLINGGV